jgi:hypothetical protein
MPDLSHLDATLNADTIAYAKRTYESIKSPYPGIVFSSSNIIGLYVVDQIAKFYEFDLTFMPTYGVVDSAVQFVELFGDALVMDQGNFFVCLTPIIREYQPETNGWRWRKNGEYFGTQKPTSEYLFDDTGIDYVLQFNICKIIN